MNVAICLAVALGINWIAFVPANAKKTERFYDLTGAISNISIAVVAYFLGEGGTVDKILLAMVALWAARLGVFLALRISKDGKDDRFEKIKQSPAAFFQTWTLQGVWGFLTQLAAIIVMTNDESETVSALTIVGLAIWILGFGMEVVADRQKRAFRADAANDGRFISTGLWAWSKHPNYFGEIVLWIGVAVVALPALSGWGYIGLISPVFVILLLTRVSGIPLLERKAEKRWGDEPEYQRYSETTPVLIPRPPVREF